MMKKIIILLMVLFLFSCGQIEFVYKNNSGIQSSLYNKTEVFFTGVDISSLYKYSSVYLGGVIDHHYDLNINIIEEKTKRSVQTNQAIEKLDYNLVFTYDLFNKNENCIVYQENIISRFTFEPKSSGYNFGSDQSLKKLYELSVVSSFEKFINNIENVSLATCLDEN